MRTTLTIDDDILQAARSLAAARNISVGKALSELARRGLRPSTKLEPSETFPIFKVNPSDPTVTPEAIKEAMEEW